MGCVIIPFPGTDGPRNELDHDWRAELRERAPGIVARALASGCPRKRVIGDWWRKEFVAEFGREPIPTFNTTREA